MQEATQIRRLNIGCGHSLLPADGGYTLKVPTRFGYREDIGG